jgi:hypothetical protein
MILARDEVSSISIMGTFVNEAAGMVRASDSGRISFMPPLPGVEVRNAGLIEATDGGTIRIDGKNIVNEGDGALQARSGGTIFLADGTFRPDPALQILDTNSKLVIFSAVFENQGNRLTPGRGKLQLSGATIRSGELSNGFGTLELHPPTGSRPILENVRLSGVASGNGFYIKDTVTVDTSFNGVGSMRIAAADGDGRLQGRGTSRFESVDIDSNGFAIEIAAEHFADFGYLNILGELRNNGTIRTEEYVDVYGILSGDGIVVAPGVTVFGTVSPGDESGMLRVIGDVDFIGVDSTLSVALGETDSDLLRITGNLRLSGMHDTLTISGGEFGRSYVVSQYNGERIGLFERVTPGYNVIYDDLAKQIRVEPIPEPASMGLALIGMMAVALWRWRKRG